MHVLAMSRYGDVDRFINIAQRKTAQITDKPLPPLNLSAWRTNSNTTPKLAVLGVQDTYLRPQNNVNSSIPVFRNIISLFTR